ncbi:hypothetical protein AB0H12_06680 [Actinosynnema sp. NPDC023794]
MGNHRSFRDEQELLFMPVYAEDRDVLPVAAVCGADASGKSNLPGGLKFTSDAVRARSPGGVRAAVFASTVQGRPGGASTSCPTGRAVTSRSARRSPGRVPRGSWWKSVAIATNTLLRPLEDLILLYSVSSSSWRRSRPGPGAGAVRHGPGDDRA